MLYQKIINLFFQPQATEFESQPLDTIAENIQSVHPDGHTLHIAELSNKNYKTIVIHPKVVYDFWG